LHFLAIIKVAVVVGIIVQGFLPLQQKAQRNGWACELNDIILNKVDYQIYFASK
jgi:hypothetical protein